MNHARFAVGVALVLAASAEALAGDPPANTAKADKPAQTPASQPARAPLNLRVGDIRKYMMPNEFRAATAVDADRNTIVVEGDLPAPPLKSTQPLPQGLGAFTRMLVHHSMPGARCCRIERAAAGTAERRAGARVPLGNLECLPLAVRVDAVAQFSAALRAAAGLSPELA